MLPGVWGLVEQTTKTPSAGGWGTFWGSNQFPWIESGPTGLPGTEASSTIVKQHNSVTVICLLGLALLWTHYLNSTMRKRTEEGCPQRTSGKFQHLCFVACWQPITQDRWQTFSHRLYRTSVWPLGAPGPPMGQEKPGPSSRSGAQDKGQQSLRQAAESRGRQCALQKTVVPPNVPMAFDCC